MILRGLKCCHQSQSLSFEQCGNTNACLREFEAQMESRKKKKKRKGQNKEEKP